MARDDDDEDPPVYGPIIVKRAVYEAGVVLCALERDGKTNGQKSFWVAQERAEKCRAAGDGSGAAFWDAVNHFAYEYDICRDKGTEIVILEEGEVYNPPEDQEIR